MVELPPLRMEPKVFRDRIPGGEIFGASNFGNVETEGFDNGTDIDS